MASSSLDLKSKIVIISILDYPDARKLSSNEIELLKHNGNRVEKDEWDRVRVRVESELFNPTKIINCYFQGINILGSTESEDESANCELRNTTFENCIIHDFCKITNTNLIRNTEIFDNVKISGCGTVSYDGSSQCGELTDVLLGNEIGKRVIPINSSMTFAEASRIVEKKSELVKYSPEIKICNCNIIEKNCDIENCNSLTNIKLSPSTKVSGSSLKDTTIISSSKPVHILNMCVLDHVIIKDGCKIENLAIVSNSLIFEGCHIINHGKITDSIIGPYTATSCGEIHNSFLGPYVAAHHQSLVQSAIILDGKCNIAYGSNIGSNHTGRAPDQELWSGEGVFFGLGCNIKYPINLIESPHSIIASGVLMLPQTMSMPFSLVNSPVKNYPDISPVYNEIFPGWIIYQSPYSLVRNARKYRTRTTGNGNITTKVLTMKTIQYIIQAKNQLESVKNTGEKDKLYTDQDVPGLGKNFMVEESRVAGINAYKRAILLYALEGLFDECLKQNYTDPKMDINQIENVSAEFKFQIQLINEYLSTNLLSVALKKYVLMKEKLFADSRDSKNRDDIRGRKIIPDYDDYYEGSENDTVINSEKEIFESQKSQIAQLL